MDANKNREGVRMKKMVIGLVVGAAGLGTAVLGGLGVHKLLRR